MQRTTATPPPRFWVPPPGQAAGAAAGRGLTDPGASLHDRTGSGGVAARDAGVAGPALSWKLLGPLGASALLDLGAGVERLAGRAAATRALQSRQSSCRAHRLHAARRRSAHARVHVVRAGGKDAGRRERSRQARARRAHARRVAATPPRPCRSCRHQVSPRPTSPTTRATTRASRCSGSIGLDDAEKAFAACPIVRARRSAEAALYRRAELRESAKRLCRRRGDLRAARSTRKVAIPAGRPGQARRGLLGRR